TEWMVQQMHLSLPLVRELLEDLRQQLMLDVLGQTGVFGSRYALAPRGRERAARALELSGYVGPAPVSLEAYTALLAHQLDRCTRPAPEQVHAALADLVLPEDALRVGGMALASGRSLFVFGPPGNGKTSLGRLLHRAVQGEIWVPYCISIDSS